MLEERLASNKNIITKDTTTFAWVGDLVADSPDRFLVSLMNRLAQLQKGDEKSSVWLETDELFEKLNGAFAIVFANAEGFCIVTDPMSFVPVYAGKDCHGNAAAFGTHPDLVAMISEASDNLDMVSIAEFLNAGNCTFPNTMYSAVEELKPGRAHIFSIQEKNKPSVRDFTYWQPPEEIRDGYDEAELAEELLSILRNAVERRCNTQKVAVLLSGGLDSRLVMAAVPESVECIALTFCDELNRETKIASQIAKCYNREWFPLIRNAEFLGKSIVNVVKFVGCEFEWVHAHNIGFVDRINELGVDALLSGMLFDSYLKAYMAHDMVKIRRLGGIAQPTFKRKVVDYADNIMDFWKQNLNSEIASNVYDRRKCHYENNMDSARGSIEWLDIYPFSQDCEAAYWVADRRVLSLRLIATDRHILDFAFKCPIELKMNSRIFRVAALGVYGPGASIPDSNYGFRPNSKRWRRLAELAVRKSQDRLVAVLEKLDRKPKVQDSWHDYQSYWQESNLLAGMKQEYAGNLDRFDGRVFKKRGRELLYQDDIGWLNGFRLLQLAIWRGLIEKYCRK